MSPEVGLLGAMFHHALHFVTHLRQAHTWPVLSGHSGLYASQIMAYHKASTLRSAREPKQSRKG